MEMLLYTIDVFEVTIWNSISCLPMNEVLHHAGHGEIEGWWNWGYKKWPLRLTTNERGIEVMRWHHETPDHLATVARTTYWVVCVLVKFELRRGSSLGYSAMSKIYSSYFYQLEEVTKQRYIETLDKLGGGFNDPYLCGTNHCLWRLVEWASCGICWHI